MVKKAKKTRARHATLLKVGGFYWAQLRSAASGEPLPGWEPVRFTGADSSGRDTWDYIGHASVDGHHFVEVHRKGPKIAGAPK